MIHIQQQRSHLHQSIPFIFFFYYHPITTTFVFGCLCYVHNQKTAGDKFASRINKSAFLGYPFGKKGWHVYNIGTGIVSISQDVIFCETEFPLASSTTAILPVPAASIEQFQFDFLDEPITSVPVSQMTPPTLLPKISNSDDTT